MYCGLLVGPFGGHDDESSALSIGHAVTLVVVLVCRRPFDVGKDGGFQKVLTDGAILPLYLWGAREMAKMQGRVRTTLDWLLAGCDEIPIGNVPGARRLGYRLDGEFVGKAGSRRVGRYIAAGAGPKRAQYWSAFDAMPRQKRTM